MATSPAFPLRFHDQRLRGLVRELSDRANISQNEFIERAVEREVVLHGALAARELAAAAERLARLSDEQYESLVARSLVEFAAGEGLPDPLEARALHDTGDAAFHNQPVDTVDPWGVLAQFDSAGR